MDENLKQTLAGIPPTKEELDNVRAKLSGEQTKETINKAHDHNEKVRRAQKMVAMFKTEEFVWFWEMIHITMKKLLDHSPSLIRGNPFEKLERLSLIQGGLDLLESQEIQKKVVEKTAESEFIEVEELEEKLRVINQYK